MTQSQKKNVTIGGIVGGSVILAALLALSGFETKASHAADIHTEQSARNLQYERLLCEIQALRRQDKGVVCR